MSWQQNPVTQAYLKILNERIEKLQQDILTVQYNEVHGLRSADIRGRLLELQRINTIPKIKGLLRDYSEDYDDEDEKGL